MSSLRHRTKETYRIVMPLFSGSWAQCCRIHSQSSRVGQQVMEELTPKAIGFVMRGMLELCISDDDMVVVAFG